MPKGIISRLLQDAMEHGVFGLPNGWFKRQRWLMALIMMLTPLIWPLRWLQTWHIRPVCLRHLR